MDDINSEEWNWLWWIRQFENLHESFCRATVQDELSKTYNQLWTPVRNDFQGVIANNNASETESNPTQRIKFWSETCSVRRQGLTASKFF